MSISQRADGRWLVKYKDEDGKWRQKSFRSQEKAEAFEGEISNAFDSNRMTVLDAVVSFLRNVPHVKSKINTYKWLVTEGYASALKYRYIDTLGRRDLEAMREACRAGGIKAASINVYTGMLKAAFNWAAEQDLIQQNPWGKYRSLPCRHQSRTGTLDEFKRVYHFLPPWMQWAATTAIALCLRPGKAELFNLKWDSFDWRSESVNVYMPKVQATKTVYPPEGYMRLAAEIHEHTTSKYVCPCPHGYPTRSYGYFWSEACKKAGVQDMPMYSLRHIAASQMIAAGADIAAVAAQLGHRDITTTGAFYTHAVSGAQKRAAACLPDLVQTSDMVQANATIAAS